MSLLKDLLEDAAAGDASGAAGGDAGAGVTSAHNIAGVREPINKNKKKKSKKKMKNTLLSRMVREEAEPSFNSSDVISKLQAAEKHNEQVKDTQGFALEDDEGRIIKVYVKSEQATEFEQALANEIDDTQHSKKEIAEVLFQLRTSFDIVDVVWPSIPEDEEVEEDIIDKEGKEPKDKESDDKEDEGVEGLDDEGKDVEGLDDEDVGGEDVEAAKSALDKVIDMMKADADARKAEAEAKKAEADKEASKYAAQAAEQRVKAEEETLEMDDYYNKQKEAEDEAKKLAKVAKYRHDKAREAKGMLDMSESAQARPVLNTRDIADKSNPRLVKQAIIRSMTQAGYSRQEARKSVRQLSGTGSDILEAAKSFIEVRDPKDIEHYLRNRLQADE